jgi:hypothetical protein
VHEDGEVEPPDQVFEILIVLVLSVNDEDAFLVDVKEHVRGQKGCVEGELVYIGIAVPSGDHQRYVQTVHLPGQGCGIVAVHERVSGAVVEHVPRVEDHLDVAKRPVEGFLKTFD